MQSYYLYIGCIREEEAPCCIKFQKPLGAYRDSKNSLYKDISVFSVKYRFPFFFSSLFFSFAHRSIRLFLPRAKVPASAESVLGYSWAILRFLYFPCCDFLFCWSGGARHLSEAFALSPRTTSHIQTDS